MLLFALMFVMHQYVLFMPSGDILNLQIVPEANEHQQIESSVNHIIGMEQMRVDFTGTSYTS